MDTDTAIGVVCSRLRELREALSAATTALEISSGNARVAALQTWWDRLRAGFETVLDERGAEMVDIPGGASGCWCAATRARTRPGS